MRFILVVASLATVPTALFAQTPQTVDARIETVEAGQQAPVAPKSQSVQLERASGAVPGDLHDAWKGTVKIGGKEILICLGKSDERVPTPDMLLVDLDGDGQMGAAEQMPLEVSSREARGTTVVTGKPVSMGLMVGESELMVRASFQQMGDQAPRLTLQFPQFMAAEAKIGDEAFRIGVIDDDLDGVYGSAGDMWGMAPASGRGVNTYGLSTMSEKPFHNGHLVQIRVQGDSIEVRANPADAPDPATLASHRERVEHLWAERFDAERESFITGRGLDTSRATTEQPVAWQYVSFDEAIEMGKSANKPVFIDVMAFWCVWCYRMDYYTYPDAEVAKLLNEKFIPVKIIQEQDLAGDYDRVMKEKLQAQGIPAMGVFDADGNVVHTIGGWKKPEDFITELKTALR